MEYVISKFINQYVSSKGEYNIYCSRSNSILTLSKELYDYLLKCANDSSLIELIDSETVELLKRHAIIVNKNADTDYLLERQFLENQISFSTETVNLVLAPTLACNFNCSYCFETNRISGKMNDEKIDQLITFIKKHKLAKNISITWFGGEPLLALNVIEKILSKIHQKVNLKLVNHSIVTNGYYFTGKTIEVFKENHLDNIQISIDGKKERHDAIKKQKNTLQGTYDVIISNIDNIVKELPNTNISIRVNLDKESSNDFIDLYHHLTERWKNNKVNIYPGILRIDNEENNGLSPKVLSQWETFELLYKLRKEKILGGQTFPCHQFHKGCSATMVNSYVVGPQGEIYKCWNDVGNNERIIGYIYKEKMTNSSLFYKYMVGSKIYEDIECLNCSLLPICAGKCAFYQLKNKYENGHYILCECMQKSPDLLEKCLDSYQLNKGL